MPENWMGLEEVTYDSLEPGDFMPKWLLPDPIKVGVGDASDSHQEQIDPTFLDPNVTMGERHYQRLALARPEAGVVSM